MLRMPQIRQRLGYQKQSLMSQATSAPMLPKMPLKRHSTVQRDANPPPPELLVVSALNPSTVQSHQQICPSHRARTTGTVNSSKNQAHSPLVTPKPKVFIVQCCHIFTHVVVTSSPKRDSRMYRRFVIFIGVPVCASSILTSNSIAGHGRVESRCFGRRFDPVRAAALLMPILRVSLA